jgi:hypothetical protein
MLLAVVLAGVGCSPTKEVQHPATQASSEPRQPESSTGGVVGADPDSSVPVVRAHATIRFSPDDWPEMGRVFPGAAVRVVATEDEATQVELPFRTLSGERLRGWIPTWALAPQQSDGKPPAPLFGLYYPARRVTFERRLDDAYVPFAESRCKSFRVLIRDPKSSLSKERIPVAQYHQGVELFGHAKVSEIGGPHESAACEPAARAQVPEGWTVVKDPDSLAGVLASELQPGATWYWVGHEAGATVCQDWTVNEENEKPALVHRSAVLHQGEVVPDAKIYRYGLNVEGASLWLSGPRWSTPKAFEGRRIGGPDGHMPCGVQLSVVRNEPDGLAMLSSHSYGPPDPPHISGFVAGYPPARIDHWYRTREACEQALACEPKARSPHICGAG